MIKITSLLGAWMHHELCCPCVRERQILEEWSTMSKRVPKSRLFWQTSWILISEKICTVVNGERNIFWTPLICAKSVINKVTVCRKDSKEPLSFMWNCSVTYGCFKTTYFSSILIWPKSSMQYAVCKHKQNLKYDKIPICILIQKKCMYEPKPGWAFVVKAGWKCF